MRTRFAQTRRIVVGVARSTLSLALALAMTVAVFLVLPFLQQVGHPPESDLEVRSVGTASLPPPPPQEEEQPEEQKPEEQPPPELTETAQPLDLSQLELALNPGFGDGTGGDFGVQLPGMDARSAAAQQDDTDAIFSMADLDQAPRVVHQPAPDYPADLRRKKIEGVVQLVFIVDKAGRVDRPTVQSATHPALEQPALQAVKRWRFDPGKRNGQAVQFRMRVPISFRGKANA